MNYIIEIRMFNNLIELERLSTGQIALWYALMHINNQCGWKEWFTVPNQKLVLLTGLTRQGIIKARAVLVKKGILSIKTNGRSATSYHLHPLQQTFKNRFHTDLQNSLQSSLQGGLQDGLQERFPLIKQNKKKQNNDNKKKRSLNIEELDSFWDTVPKLQCENTKTK